MRLPNILLPLLISLSLNIHAQRGYIPTSEQLSDQAELSILTCGPGKDLYSSFGHSAFRLKDTETGLDIVYNYGTFDFNTPNFYSKFVLGKLPYMLSVSPYRNFQYVYYKEGRSIHEQHLNLNSVQLNKVVNYLFENMKEENRYYLYDFFDDNCATKLVEVLEESLDVSDLQIEDASDFSHLSFRSMVRAELVDQPWAKWGIDLALGSLIDRPLTELQDNFLPKSLEKNIKISSIGSKPLISTERSLLRQVYQAEKPNEFTSPSFVFLYVIIIGIFFLFKGSKYDWFFYKSFYFLLGLTGLVLLFMWVFTDHYYVKWNWNILWANPMWLILILRNHSKPLILFLLASMVLVLLIDFMHIQLLPEGIAFLIYLMMIKLIMLLRKAYKNVSTASA